MKTLFVKYTKKRVANHRDPSDILNNYIGRLALIVPLFDVFELISAYNRASSPQARLNNISSVCYKVDPNTSATVAYYNKSHEIAQSMRQFGNQCTHYSLLMLMLVRVHCTRRTFAYALTLIARYACDKTHTRTSRLSIVYRSNSVRCPRRHEAQAGAS